MSKYSKDDKCNKTCPGRSRPRADLNYQGNQQRKFQTAHNVSGPPRHNASSVGSGRQKMPASSVGSGRQRMPPSSVGSGRQRMPPSSVGSGRQRMPPSSVDSGRQRMPPCYRPSAASPSTSNMSSRYCDYSGSEREISSFRDQSNIHACYNYPAQTSPQDYSFTNIEDPTVRNTNYQTPKREYCYSNSANATPPNRGYGYPTTNTSNIIFCYYDETEEQYEEIDPQIGQMMNVQFRPTCVPTPCIIPQMGPQTSNIMARHNQQEIDLMPQPCRNSICSTKPGGTNAGSTDVIVKQLNADDSPADNRCCASAKAPAKASPKSKIPRKTPSKGSISKSSISKCCKDPECSGSKSPLCCKDSKASLKKPSKAQQSESKKQSINMLSVVISTVMLLAAEVPNIPQDYSYWSKKYLKCIKNAQGQYPTNIKKILAMLSTEEEINELLTDGQDCKCPKHKKSIKFDG